MMPSSRLTTARELYPNEAWADFQHWFRTVYLPTKYPTYILKKANVLPGGMSDARQLAAMYQPKEIGGPN